jgi:hypothetical protein
MRKLIGTLSLLVMFLIVTMQSRAALCNAVASNLVSNCGFESGSFSSWTGTATTIGPNYAGIDTSDPFTINPTPYEGGYEAYLGGFRSTIALTQTLATTAGSVYQIEFALLNDTNPSTNSTNSFALLFGGMSLFSQTATPADAYTLYTLMGTATSSSTALSFVSENDGGYFELDSVSVRNTSAVAVTPEPSSFVLLGTGVLGVVGVIKRRLA